MNILDVIVFENDLGQRDVTDSVTISRIKATQRRVTNLTELRDRISRLRKDVFAPDDRIAIVHNDVDHFYHGSPISFTAHNLFTIIRELDMPLYVFMIVTPWHDFNRAVEPFIIHPEDRPTVVQTLFPLLLIELVDDWDDLEKDINFNAMAMMGKPRSHRIKLFQYLQSLNTDSIKYNFKGHGSKDLVTDGPPPAPDILGTVASFPHGPDENWPRLATNVDFISLDRYSPEARAEEILEIRPDTTERESDPLVYQKFAIDIVTETVYDVPMAYLSEKTLRTIVFKTPFIILGPKRSLEHLRSYGFETFGDYWDESYDQIEDPVERFMACCKVIKMINDMPLDDMKQMYEDMLPLLERNRETLLNYVDNEWRPLYNKIYV